VKHSRLIATALVTAVLTATPVLAYAAHTDGGIYVVKIDGTAKGGFVKHWSDGETQTYIGIQKAIDACWAQGGGEVTQRCLGVIDGLYPQLTEEKRAIEKAGR
jgi:hypothetical protein